MQNIIPNIKITINDKLYVKDPETSELGRNILKNSIELIDKIGFEAPHDKWRKRDKMNDLFINAQENLIKSNIIKESRYKKG